MGVHGSVEPAFAHRWAEFIPPADEAGSAQHRPQTRVTSQGRSARGLRVVSPSRCSSLESPDQGSWAASQAVSEGGSLEASDRGSWGVCVGVLAVTGCRGSGGTDSDQREEGLMTRETPHSAGDMPGGTPWCACLPEDKVG